MNIFENCYFDNGIIINGNKVIIDDKEYDIPEHVGLSNISVINNKIYINGYELIRGKWKKTLRALWHKYF